MKLLFITVMMFGAVAFGAPSPTPSPTPKASATPKATPKKLKQPSGHYDTSELKGWLDKKVANGQMSQKQEDDALKHPEAIQAVMVSEKKKKGVK